MLEKYGDYNTLYNGIHHYETKEVKNSNGVTIVPAGLEVQNNYTVNYFDYFTDQQIQTGNLSIPITNYDYEKQIDEDKRNIFVLKPFYLNVVVNDLDELVRYKEGSSQYVSEDLVKGDNIRLYQ